MATVTDVAGSRQQRQQEYLALKDAGSLLNKIASWKFKSAGQESMLGKKQDE